MPPCAVREPKLVHFWSGTGGRYRGPKNAVFVNVHGPVPRFRGVVPNGTERYSFSGLGRGASPSSNGAPVSSPAGPFDVDVPRFPTLNPQLSTLNSQPSTLNPQPIRRPSSFDGLRHGLRWQAQRDTAFTRHRFQCAPSPIRTACWPSTLDFRHSTLGPRLLRLLRETPHSGRSPARAPGDGDKR